MYRFPLYRPLICAGLGLLSWQALAAYQPQSEAALAADAVMECQFNADHSSDCTTTQHYTILTPVGREMLSRIDFSYAETDGFELRKAEFTQPGGKPTALAPAQIDTRTAPNPEQGFLREKQTSLAFPNLRVGTRLSYTVQQHYAAKPLLGQFHSVLQFGPKPVRQDSFKITYRATRPIIWRSEQMDDYRFTASSDRKKLTIEQKAPVFLNYINEPAIGFIRQVPRVELGSSTEVQDYFGPLAQRYQQILTTPLPPASAKAVAALRELPPAGKVAGLMQHINDNYRYLGDWRATERGYVPFELEQIEQRGYGDCKDLAVLLAAMLKASGIKAETAWVSRENVVAPLLIPGTHAPNHAIVRAEVNGKVWWLDPTNPVFDPGRSMPDIQERWAFVSDANGQVRQDYIPLEAPDTSIVLDKQEHFDRAGQARVNARIEFSHMELMRLMVSDNQNGIASNDQSLCERFTRELRDCQIDREPTAFVAPRTYRVKASLTDLKPLENISGSYFYKSPALEGDWDFLVNYRRNGQLADLYIGDANTLRYTITLSGAQLDKDVKACNVRSPWFDMDLRSERVKGEYRYHYRLSQKKRWLSHEDIVSAPFEAMVSQAKDCSEQARQLVQLKGAAKKS
ncbi:Transglutaminase-like enzyme, putative cysteine protease [Pseudomonas chlororaphis subsp. aureofaciens]|uniref:DUF3857 domain-containing transglutaminase family protein n=1 Tax=Pseudomonas chlororaphis TaxID=587753 RepID=UPI000F56CDB5|nr:DUF3857 domain-containing transglutaminase family protein [Pseudomonas chlororaphis]AZD85392.1 Transglutaminase-like enzyme, putative cysteine protease [Pseudomonas chlororaphis subsp. aureofaciens]